MLCLIPILPDWEWKTRDSGLERVPVGYYQSMNHLLILVHSYTQYTCMCFVCITKHSVLCRHWSRAIALYVHTFEMLTYVYIQLSIGMLQVRLL